MNRFRKVLNVVLVGAALMCSFAAEAQTDVVVGTAAELQAAVANANSAGGNRRILVKDGTYTLSDTLYVNAPSIKIIGQSGDRTKVTIQGTAMAENASVLNVIRVAASNFEISDVTLQKSGWHLIQVVGDNNADNTLIHNCILRDAYEQMIKVTFNTAVPSVVSDNGRVENCLFEYTAGIGPNYYIGGIDAHGAKNWVVTGNTFKNIASPSNTVSEFAVHFWNGSADNIVERNTIINCDRGVGMGLDGTGKVPNTRGIVRNNFIYHSNNGAPFADVGIALTNSIDTQVYNNTIIFDNGFSWSIEYRFATTTGARITNNLSNKQVLSRNGGTGTVTSNVINAAGSWFVSPSTGNLHLASANTAVVDKGTAVTGLTNDFDGQARSGAVDIGADEYGAAAKVPNPPTNVQAN